MAKRPTPKRQVRVVPHGVLWQVVDASTGVPQHLGGMERLALDSYLATRGMVVVSTKPKEKIDG